MEEHSNATLVRRAYEAFAQGDTAILAEVFAEDAVWHEAGRGQISGDFKGRDEILAMLARAGELTDGTFEVEVHDVVANDRHAVALHHATGHRAGRRLDISEILVCHVDGGKISEIWHAASNLYAFDHFWE
jgi:uncharacterized protein (TIGR02246 family)